ncbi:hypothetical protein [Rubricoccus marinus]|uniref:hypothetical protein n=1 Tax=Rubricoccus marinus TaxID=716817 RepID=UPI00117A3DAB|nr:hypothetical protein [Rubricoccus marinus]
MLSFYKGSERITVPGCCKRSDLLHTMEIPEELAEMLMEPGALRFLKLGDISGEKNVVYTTLMEGEREERR